jgi:heterodisulfide reductase subunit B
LKYAYYPGCSMHSATAREYERSLLAVARVVGLELAEVENWHCCGSGAAHSVSRLLGTALPLDNLVSTRRMGLDEVVVPCPSCFSRFKSALHEVENEPELRTQVEEIVEGDYRAEILHPLQVFSRPSMLAAIANARKQTFADLKVVCYYGCLLTRPPKVARFDDVEYPQSMDDVLRAAGVQTLDWSCKTACCGASLTVTRKDIVVKLCHDIFQAAKDVGADAIAVACPLCQLNLDTREEEVEHEYEESYQLPILYFTQLIAMAFGLSPGDVMLRKHFVVPDLKLAEVTAGA